MIIVMKPKAADKNIKAVTQYIEANGLTAHLSQGEQVTICLLYTSDAADE